MSIIRYSYIIKFVALAFFALRVSVNSTSVKMPIIDISPLLFNVVDDLNPLEGELTRSGADLQACIRSIDLALTIFGCFVATGTNIKVELAASAQKASDLIFHQDEAILDSIAIKPGNFMRGYLPFGKESGLKTYFEPKEGYSYGYKWSKGEVKENALHGDNVWPNKNEIESSVPMLDTLFASKVDVAEKLARALSTITSDGNSTAFDQFIEPGGKISVMRIFHYFSRNSMRETFNDKEKSGKIAMGSSPHTDWGFLTLILQDDIGGLQFLYQDDWVDVPYIPNSIVVNAGDFLSVISGGRFHSPVHRVIAPIERDRTSFVFFYYPRFETPMDPSLFKRISASASSSQNCAEPTNCLGHNSLFVIDNLVDDSMNSTALFGDYIIEKWKGVNAY